LSARWKRGHRILTQLAFTTRALATKSGWIFTPNPGPVGQRTTELNVTAKLHATRALQTEAITSPIGLPARPGLPPATSTPPPAWLECASSFPWHLNLRNRRNLRIITYLNELKVTGTLFALRLASGAAISVARKDAFHYIARESGAHF
jgi:hypothetical protein